MAYNVLKGAVEGSVDQHADQEIEGVKVFKNIVSASVFYDTDAQSPCATLKDVAITAIIGASETALLTRGTSTNIVAHHDLTYSDGTLKVKAINTKTIAGSAAKMTDIPHNQFVAPIKADFIELGRGLKNVRGKLQVENAAGIKNTEEGISLSLKGNGGLSISGGDLKIDPQKTLAVTEGGQNLSDNDLLVITDVSRGAVANTTLANFYENYVQVKMPHAAGSKGAIQLKGNSGFDGTSTLWYDLTKNQLNIEGTIQTQNLEVENTLHCRGAVIANIKTIKSETYEIEATDYTILCDSIDNTINIVLPPACNHTGRILSIKKTNQQKYNLRSFPVIINVKEGTIDINDQVVLKMNYSCRTFQSDGENWWVIGAKGT